MAKSSSKPRKGRSEKNPKDEQRQRIVTMQALQDLSSDDDGELPPESKWGKDALALKAAIEAGTFDAAVIRSEEEEEGAPFEEVELDDDDEGDDEDEGDKSFEKNEQNDVEDDIELDSDKANDGEGSDIEENDEEDDAEGIENDLDNTDEIDTNEKIGNDDSDTEEEEVVSDDDEEEGDSPTRSSEYQATQGKALRIVATSLTAEKKNWPWAETFAIIPPTILPFSDTKDVEGGGPALGVHDDLQREVAFYDLALEAALEAKKRCQIAGIPFTRPDDFFAEMVKTDEHMARVKDRLIFESKKIEAVAQRKSNKEQKLRAKEMQAHKLAEKAKKKRDHFQEVATWAESARNQETSIKSKKRAFADQKYGYGGKRGRFKQNDSQSMNDMSSFNKRQGTFVKKPTTMKNGSGANRKGKRARDASRSR